MASLDTVLQTIVPQRQILAGHGAKNEVDTDSQPGSGFEDVLAQSGAKDENAENATEPEKAGPKVIFSKQNNAFHQLKMQLSDKASVKEAVADPKVLPTTTKVENNGATDDLLIADLATEVSTKEVSTTAADDLVQSDPKNLVPTQSKRKDVAKIEVRNLANVSRSIERTQNDEKVSADLTSTKVELPLNKELVSAISTDKKAAEDLSGKIVIPDKTEKSVKTGRHAVEKKTETAKAVDVKADEAATSPQRTQSLLDILGGDPISNILNLPSQGPALKAEKTKTTEDPAASVLEAVSQPVTDHKLRHPEHGQDRSVDSEIQKADKQAETDTNTLFRFSKADGSEKPVDLRFGTSDKSTDTPASAQATMNKIENVVVLEARRYLALAPESNAFNLVSNIVGDKELSTAMTSSIIDPSKSTATSKVVNTLKLQMNPHDLGTVTATLRLRGEELSVAITVQNSAAYNHMTSDQDKMIDALRAQGFAVDQVTVQLVSADRSSFQDQQGQSSNQGQQQQPRDGAAAQQGRQQGNGSPQDNSSSRSGLSTDMGRNTGTSSAVSDRSDGQVYI